MVLEQDVVKEINLTTDPNAVGLTENIERKGKDTTYHKYFKGDKWAGTVTTYDPSCKNLPLEMRAFVDEEGKRFLERLIDLRVKNGNPVPQSPELPMFEEWKRQDSSEFICPLTGSRRRYILPVKYSSDDAESLIEVKVLCSRKNFEFAVNLMRGYGKESGLAEPIMMVKLPEDTYKLYDRTEKRSPRMVFYRYFDGRRLWDITPEYLDYIENEAGKSKDEIIYSIATEPLKILSRMSNLRISDSYTCRIDLGSEEQFHNFFLTKDGRVSYVCDFGTAELLYFSDSWVMRISYKINSAVFKYEPFNIESEIHRALKKLGIQKKQRKELIREGRKAYDLIEKAINQKNDK